MDKTRKTGLTPRSSDVIDAMKRALANEKGFRAVGKYRVRVINRALNELLGTNNTVN